MLSLDMLELFKKHQQLFFAHAALQLRKCCSFLIVKSVHWTNSSMGLKYCYTSRKFNLGFSPHVTRVIWLPQLSLPSTVRLEIKVEPSYSKLGDVAVVIQTNKQYNTIQKKQKQKTPKDFVCWCSHFIVSCKWQKWSLSVLVVSLVAISPSSHLKSKSVVQMADLIPCRRHLPFK